VSLGVVFVVLIGANVVEFRGYFRMSLRDVLGVFRGCFVVSLGGKRDEVLTLGNCFTVVEYASVAID